MSAHFIFSIMTIFVKVGLEFSDFDTPIVCLSLFVLNTMESNAAEDLQTPSQENMQGPLGLQVEQPRPSLSYVWTTNQSVFSNDVDQWIAGDRASPINTGVQPSRTIEAQQRPLVPDTSGFWYGAAMVLPLFSMGRTRNWRCTTSTILNTAELLLSHVAGFCGRARSRLRALNREQTARDIIAGAMDVILVIYALGFLLLSLYHASVFQQI